MSATPRGFTNNGGSLLGLQVEGKLLTSGKRPVRGEHIHWLIDKTLSRNPRQCPVLMSLIVVASSEVIDVRRLLEKIRNHEIHHAGIAAMILTQVKDERIRVGHEVHCRDDCRPAELRRRESIKFDVADIVVQDFKLGERAVLMLEHRAKARLLSGAGLVWPRSRTRRLGNHKRIVSDKKVLIVADGAQVPAERVGEIVAVGHRVVVAMLLVVMDRLNHLGSHIGIDIVIG